ncbi:hypothetical protein LEMLEM_LOCUS20531, partial [Lemmus lemmus]
GFFQRCVTILRGKLLRADNAIEGSPVEIPTLFEIKPARGMDASTRLVTLYRSPSQRRSGESAQPCLP